jgi:hypothetical protein
VLSAVFRVWVSESVIWGVRVQGVGGGVDDSRVVRVHGAWSGSAFQCYYNSYACMPQFDTGVDLVLSV